jgi:hypothetical protein
MKLMRRATTPSEPRKPATAARDASVPGFRHRTHEPEYARLGLPFCRQDSLRKLPVLLDEEAASKGGAR